MAATVGESKAQYSAIVLGATGNVGGRIVQLLIKNPLCKKVVVVTRRKTDAFAWFPRPPFERRLTGGPFPRSSLQDRYTGHR